MNNMLASSVDLKGTMTAQEVLDKAGLNWTAQKEPCYLANGRIVNDTWAVTRSDTGTQVGVVGNVYKVFQNKPLAQVMETFASEKLATFKRGWCWAGGSRVGIVAELPQHLYVLGKDELAVQIAGLNSFDGSSPVGYSIEVLRLVCSNGLKRFVKKGHIMARHCASTAEQLMLGRKALGLAVNSMGDILAQAEKLARKQANKDTVEAFLKSMQLNKVEDESTRRENQRYDLLRRFDAGIGLTDPAYKHSLWAIYNAATEMVDHKNGTADIEKKAVSSVYGSGARFKEDALSAALALAN